MGCVRCIHCTQKGGNDFIGKSQCKETKDNENQKGCVCLCSCLSVRAYVFEFVFVCMCVRACVCEGVLSECTCVRYMNV